MLEIQVDPEEDFAGPAWWARFCANRFGVTVSFVFCGVRSYACPGDSYNAVLGRWWSHREVEQGRNI